jgi:Uncharacterized protein conserved in bacteria (DUF2219)
MRVLGTALAAMTAWAGFAMPVLAQEQQTLGYGRLFTNDLLGDGQDRWRSGSYSFSVVRGRSWDGAPTSQFGGLLEYRLRTEIIAPLRGTGPLGDRPYVGAISLGLHSHTALGPTELSVGADLVLTGPQTGVSEFQNWYHETFSLPNPPGIANQLDNAAYAAGTAQLVWPVRVSETLTLRPFVELQSGVEDLVRVGGDVVIGGVGQQDLLLRDVATGQLYRGIEGPQTGFGYVVGADFTQVKSSVYLPESMGYFPQEDRIRARAGVHWQLAPQTSFFYGMTWLSPEFEGQPEGQLLGSVKLNFNF